MSICLDIYVLSDKRNKETIEWFINEYIDQEKHKIMGDDLQITSLNKSENNLGLEDYEWEPAINLSHAIQRGLDYPRRAFSLYLKTIDSSIDQAIISFTTDNKIIFGLSIENFPEEEKNVLYAKKLLNDLINRIDPNYGFCMVEEPPPSNEDTFIQLLNANSNWALVKYKKI